jgi:ABC-type dipeptide/oligopeptide/nickel transport system ATPase component
MECDIEYELKTIRKGAEKNYELSLDLFNNALKAKELPDGHYSQLKSESIKNMMFTYTESERNQALEIMNESLFRTILSLPIKQVHLSFVDMNLSGGVSDLTRHLDKSLYGDIISDNQQLDALFSLLKKRMVDVLEEYGDLQDYQKKNKIFKYPYEIVVILDEINKKSTYYPQLLTLLKQGNKGGIFFILMHQTENPNESLNDIWDVLEFVQEKLCDTNILGYGNLYFKRFYWKDLECRKSIFDYIQSEVDKKPVSNVEGVDVHDLVGISYTPVTDSVEIPVGIDEKANVNFKLDTISHVHSFIIGQSGSGKSVFLHNVIMGAIAKYAPEDLQLYLLDFKLGGVEFNRYRNVKHLKALLVDNSDIQITLEILRDLSESMKERGRLLRDAGVSNIGEYNQRNPDNRMPQIILIADECHEMFNPHGNKDRKQFNEIASIMAKLAKEGRSQGVHMVLATQTLAQAEISSEILNNITDHYLLKCAAGDSERMVRDSSTITGSLKTGDVYYHHVENQTQFHSYYINKEDSDAVISQIIEKCEPCKSNGQFYFSGSQVFHIDQRLVDELAEKGGRNPVAAIGRSISLKNDSVNVTLRKDDGENIMVTGIDDDQQVSRTTMNIMVSIILSANKKDIPVRISVLNFLNEDESRYMDVLEQLDEQGAIKMIGKRKMGQYLYDLATDIKNEEAKRQVIFILGQERFRQLKLDEEIELEDSGTSQFDDSSPFGALSFGSPSSTSVDAKFNSFKKALAYIMSEGPAQGVHTVLQLDKPDKFLYEDYVSSKMILSKFNHIVILRSEEKVAMTLGLRDDIRPENLSSDTERLRAYYFATMNDEYKLFTPYDGADKDILKNL